MDQRARLGQPEKLDPLALLEIVGILAHVEILE
jgi:hypothetical protein